MREGETTGRDPFPMLIISRLRKLLTMRRTDAERGQPIAEHGREDDSPTDIMISYAHKDAAAMRRLRIALTAAGYAVWVDEDGLPAGSQFLSRIGEAILKSTVVIFLLSENSARSRYCKDEVAMAYMADKPIFPVCLGTFDSLNGMLDPGTRLILSGTQWTFLVESNLLYDLTERSSAWDAGVQSLDAAISEFLKMGDVCEHSLEATSNDSKSHSLCRRIIHPGTPKLRRAQTALPPTDHDRVGSEMPSKSRSKTVEFSEAEDRSPTKRISFWKRHFPTERAVPWGRFERAFLSDFEQQAEWKSLPNMDADWLLDLMHRNIFMNSDVASATAFEGFRNLAVEGIALPQENLFFTLVADMARVEVAMQQLVSMNGPISGEHRLRAILDLAQSQSHLAVVQTLIGLTLSTQADARALAVVALGRLALKQRQNRSQGVLVPRRIDALVARPAVERCLRDVDGIVRQASASALGAMCQHPSAAALFYAWRSDPLSSVRNAAYESLVRISEAQGPSVDDADAEGLHEVNEIASDIQASFALKAQIGELQEDVKKQSIEMANGPKTNPDGSTRVPRQASLPVSNPPIHDYVPVLRHTSLPTYTQQTKIGRATIETRESLHGSTRQPAAVDSRRPPYVLEDRTSSSLLKILAPSRQPNRVSTVVGG